MQKIIAANKQITICELIKRYTFDGEIDFDGLGALLDPETLDAAIDSFPGYYGVYELIEHYLKLANAPIICEVVKCHS